VTKYVTRITFLTLSGPGDSPKE